MAAILDTQAGYVSLVASRRRAGAIIERLARRGGAAERLARVKAPAGLDIGAETPREIAISILAELVKHQRRETRAEAQPGPVPEAGVEARDPVCGMSVPVATERHRSEASGHVVYFCCRRCKESFDENPDRYRLTLSPSPSRRSGEGSVP